MTWKKIERTQAKVISLSDVFLTSPLDRKVPIMLVVAGHSLNNPASSKVSSVVKTLLLETFCLTQSVHTSQTHFFQIYLFNLMLLNIFRNPGPYWRCISFSLHFTSYIYITGIRGLPIPICFYLFYSLN